MVYTIGDFYEQGASTFDIVMLMPYYLSALICLSCSAGYIQLQLSLSAFRLGLSLNDTLAHG